MFKPPPAPRAAALLLVALAGLAANACVYDSSSRCGPAMTYVAAAQACVCEANAIAVAGGCQPCAADEVATGGKCACPTGQSKDATNECVTVAGLGDACDTHANPCTDATYAYCDTHASGGTAGTCTNTCASNADCGAAYTCATWDAHPYCRTFSGVGDSCASSADCTHDAKYCDTFQTHTCVEQGCSLQLNDCERGTMCCDFSGFGLGTLCSGACQ